MLTIEVKSADLLSYDLIQNGIVFPITESEDVWLTLAEEPIGIMKIRRSPAIYVTFILLPGQVIRIVSEKIPTFDYGADYGKLMNRWPDCQIRKSRD